MAKTQIIERNHEPFRPLEVDTVTLDIIESALRNARYEMDAVLFRTAMSPGIREQHDEFPMIAERKGRMVVGQFGSFIGGFLDAYEGTVEEGDIFLTSDPYKCDGAISHSADWLVLLPIYYSDGRLVGWAAMLGHMSDVGGKVPGSLPTDATSIFEEGMLAPPIKIYRGGALQEDLLALVLNHVRMPHWNRSDLNGIVAACRTAERRVIEMCDRFGVDLFVSAMEASLERNRRAMAELIKRSIPEEEMVFEDYVCDDGRGHGPYKLRCSMKRVGERVKLDWSGTDPQSEGSINFYLNENMFRMFFGIYMIMIFDPQILYNDGFYELVDVHIPGGIAFKAALSGGAFVPHSCARPHLRRARRPAGPASAGVSVRRRIFFVAAPYVLGFRLARRMVPALPNRLRRNTRAPGGRWSRRALDVAFVHQRAQRVPRSVLSTAYRTLRDGDRQRRPRSSSRRQRN